MNRLTKAADRLSVTVLLVLALNALAAFAVSAEEAGENPRIAIRNEIYRIDGRTRPEALVSLLGPAEGLEFQDSAALEEYAADRARKLEKLRVFKKSAVRVEWIDDYLADLVVEIEDGAPVIPIPYAFYNSNDGLQAGSIVNMPNLGGTLRNLFLIGLYTAPPDENDNLRWTEPNFMLFTTVSGIELGPVSLFLGGGATRGKRTVEYRGRTGVEAEVTSLSASGGLTRRFGDRYSDTVSARVAGSPANRLVEASDPDLLAYGPLELSVSVKNTFAVDAFDWVGNFRDGWTASASAGWDRSVPRYDSIRDSFIAEAELAAYRALGPFNPGFSAYAFAASGLPQLDLGARVRGIRNGEISGNYGAFLRTGVQTRIARFDSAEIDAAPSVDLFWARDPDASDYLDDYGAAVGGEILFLFDAMKSLPVKLGFAWDCRPESRVIGGKRLEVDFSFSLSY